MGSSEETGKTFEERRKEILEVLEYEEQARREEKAEILALIEQKQRRLEELDRGLVLIQKQRLDLETQAQEHAREWEKIDLLLTELSKLLPGKVILDTLLGLRDAGLCFYTSGSGVAAGSASPKVTGTFI